MFKWLATNKWMNKTNQNMLLVAHLPCFKPKTLYCLGGNTKFVQHVAADTGGAHNNYMVPLVTA